MDIEEPLLERTERLLKASTERAWAQNRERPVTLFRRIAAEARGVPFEWLRSFAAGKSADPGVRKVQALHDWLVAEQRELAD